MENHHMLYGGFHSTTNFYSEQSSSMAAPPPPPPSINNLVASSSSKQHLHHHAVSSSSSTTNAFLQQDEEEEEIIRAKVASHPLFPQLLHNYIDCHKVGAPADMVKVLDEVREGNNGVCQISAFYAADPELDDFMETYCNLLGKYKYELSRPFEEATAFLSDMKSQLNSIIYEGSLSGKGFIRDEKKETIIDECKKINNNNNEDRELKDNLLRRYSGYIGSLKNEFSKNKKKERLPNEAKEILQVWWDIHFKWPYPTDADKVALAEWTGLDQKQINNWFINQRKRHWKPSEEIQAAVFASDYIAHDE